MSDETLWDKFYELSVIAGTNQRYNQIEMTDWAWWSTAIAVTVAITTFISLVLSLVSYFKPAKKFLYLSTSSWSVVAAGVSTAIAIILNVAPIASKEAFYADIFRRWSDLRQDVDIVFSEVEFNEKSMTDEQKSYFERRYTQLLQRKNSLNGLDPAKNDKLFEKCLIAEEHFRGVVDERQPIPKTPKQAAVAQPPRT